MNIIDTKIVPVNYPIDVVRIINVSVQLGNTANIGGIAFGNEISIPFSFDLTEAEYSAWGNDDDYIVNLILNKLGYTKA